MVIENRIIMGEVDSFGGVMYLPNHWVSVVVDFKQLKIFYGDSLGQSMPDRQLSACECWIGHLTKRSANLPTGRGITHGTLPTGCQKDSVSCGLFAPNAIAHHYLQHPLLPSDPVTLACRRIEVTLEIISTMTVC